MRFLCDVHISYKIVTHLKSLNFEVFHVNEILDKWNTKDKNICKYADENDLIIITKDSDFRNSFLINKTPRKLVKVNLGNISNSALTKALSENLPAIQKLDSTDGFMIELDQETSTFMKFR